MAAEDRTYTAGAGRGLHVYVDGCYEPVSGTGGWAFVAYRDDTEIVARFGRIERTSNNAMELRALLEAATWVNAHSAGEAAVVWSDSVYAVKGCNQWRHVWRNSGWRKKNPGSKARSRAIANADLWREIDAALSSNQRLTVAWCKGHASIPGNERADQLAERGRCS